jgi:hypothetical protein
MQPIVSGERALPSIKGSVKGMTPGAVEGVAALVGVKVVP